MAIDYSSTPPRFIGSHARDRYLDWLTDDVRFRLHEASAATPLDTADLHAAFVANPEAAYAELSTLCPQHLAMQALAMAAYLDEITGISWDMGTILTRWQAALARRCGRAAA